MKKVLLISVWVLLIGGLVFIMVYINKKHTNLKLSRVDIIMNHNNRTDFVTKADIESILKNLNLKLTTPNSLLISDINNENIERKISANPYISSVNVYSTNDGVLKINVQQSVPLIRVINNRGQSYYLNEEGKMMPLSDKYTPRIIIAHGNISDDYSPDFKLINFGRKIQIDTNNLTALQKLYIFSKFIDKSDFWKAMIDQVYFMSNGDMELYLTLGNQGVIIGGVDNLGEKLQKLLIFYKKEMSKIGWYKYKTINLKFKDQIVCTKI